MEAKDILVIINEIGINNIFFKIIIIFFAIFYYFYALVIAKQVDTMNKALQDKYNGIILFITSLQVTVSLILLIIMILNVVFV